MGQKKYPDELRERATRMTLDALADPARAKGAIRRIADELGVHPEALRTWVKKAQADGGLRPGTTTDQAQRIGLLGVFRTLLVLCFRLPSLSPGNRVRLRSGRGIPGLSEGGHDCMSARSMRQYP